MEAVEEAVYKDFEKWKKEEGNSGKDVGDFMDEMYAMKIGKGNIFDKIKAMSLPPISKDSKGSSAVLENLATCRENSNQVTNRRKRDTTDRVAGNENTIGEHLTILLSACRTNPSTATRWNTINLVTSTNFPGYQSSSSWQDCAEKCANWSGNNGKICEFWEYCSSGCPTTTNPLGIGSANICYFKARSNCNAPSKQPLVITCTAGTCPAPSGSSCGSSKNIFSYFFFNLEIHSFTYSVSPKNALSELSFFKTGFEGKWPSTAS